MRENHFRWATIIGPPPRILDHFRRLQTYSYYDRINFFAGVYGSDWIFRLLTVNTKETIAANRPSWLAFYHDDQYDAHFPLDPRAPETDAILGTDMGAKELALYSGVGFDGYSLALRTRRSIDAENCQIVLDGYHLDHLTRQRVLELADARSDELSAEHYYRLYGAAINRLYENFSAILSDSGDGADDMIENTAAALLLILCGSHMGCATHRSEAEAQIVRSQSLIVFAYSLSLSQMDVLVAEQERNE